MAVSCVPCVCSRRTAHTGSLLLVLLPVPPPLRHGALPPARSLFGSQQPSPPHLPLACLPAGATEDHPHSLPTLLKLGMTLGRPACPHRLARPQGKLLTSDSFPGHDRNKLCLTSKVRAPPPLVLCLDPFQSISRLFVRSSLLSFASSAVPLPQGACAAAADSLFPTLATPACGATRLAGGTAGPPLGTLQGGCAAGGMKPAEQQGLRCIGPAGPTCCGARTQPTAPCCVSLALPWPQVPLGVVLCIPPFNYPVNLAVRWVHCCCRQHC